jgi:hypothetical protein
MAALAPRELDCSSLKGSRLAPLLVRECIPFGSLLSRVIPLRTANVNKPQEALAVPWIEKLPGEKRIRFVNGQMFVIQNYVGCRLIRAHICLDEEREALAFLGETDSPSNAEHEMSLEYVR